jgi:hypothetical protein
VAEVEDVLCGRVVAPNWDAGGGLEVLTAPRPCPTLCSVTLCKTSSELTLGAVSRKELFQYIDCLSLAAWNESCATTEAEENTMLNRINEVDLLTLFGRYLRPLVKSSLHCQRLIHETCEPDTSSKPARQRPEWGYKPGRPHSTYGHGHAVPPISCVMEM